MKILIIIIKVIIPSLTSSEHPRFVCNKKQGNSLADPDLQIGKASGLKKIFSFLALRASIWSKNKGAGPGPPGPSPGSATETSLRKQPVPPRSSPLKTFRRRGVRRDGCFRRLQSRIGSNTEQDTEVVKNVCAPFHHSTEGCEGKEYSDPPSQPTSKSELILFVSTFRHLFSPGLRLVPSRSDYPYLITLNYQKTFSDVFGLPHTFFQVRWIEI